MGRDSCIRIEREEDLTVEMLEDACQKGDAFAMEVISSSAAAEPVNADVVSAVTVITDETITEPSFFKSIVKPHFLKICPII